jgi:hypothetical protein
MRQLIHSIPAGFQVPSTALAAVSTAILLGASYASRSQLVLLVAAVLAVVGYQLKQQLQQSPAIDAIASLQESTKGGSLQIQFAPEAARVKEVATETASAVHTEVGAGARQAGKVGYSMLALNFYHILCATTGSIGSYKADDIHSRSARNRCHLPGSCLGAHKPCKSPGDPEVR